MVTFYNLLYSSVMDDSWMTYSACRRADPLPRALFTACRHAAWEINRAPHPSCHGLEKLTLSNTKDDDILSLSVMKMIATLSSLKYLEFFSDCYIDDEAVSALNRYRGLNHISISWQDGLRDVRLIVGGVGDAC
jgi:hypothetical protein